MLVLLYLRTISHYIITLFPDYYISELLISFLPYSMIAHYGAIIICLILIIRRRWRLSTIHRRAHICFYALIYITYLTTSTYIHTYTTEEGLGTLPSSLGTELSFLYANILYTNTNITGLLKTIRAHNPDIIMMVEYADHQDQAMRPTLLVDYPYTSHYQPHSRKGYDGDIIYSRYPLTRVDTSESPRAYNHVVITKGRKHYDIVLVHTAAPVSLSFWRLRQRQMDTFASDLGGFIEKKRSSKIAIFGDFNITPWADSYHDFDTTMHSLGMSDMTTDLSSFDTTDTDRPMDMPGGITTRGHMHIPFARAHIDHSRRSKSLRASYRIIDIPGSDHDGFVGTLNQ